MLLLKLSLVLLVLGATALFGFVWWFTNHAVYRFDPTRHEPGTLGLPTIRVVRFRGEDGAEISAWLSLPRAGQPMLISCFGGFACVGPSVARLQPVLDQGLGLAMLVYRSSSGDGGTPSEAAFAADARALWDQLDALLGVVVPPQHRVLHGFSLGSSVAAGLAAERPAAGLVLEGSFDRCCRWFSTRAFGLPMCRLMWRERHDVAQKLAAVTLPKLLLHGRLDDTIPLPWAHDLHDAIPPPKRIVVYDRGGHTDLMQHGAAADLVAFAREVVRR